MLCVFVTVLKYGSKYMIVFAEPKNKLWLKVKKIKAIQTDNKDIWIYFKLYFESYKPDTNDQDVTLITGIFIVS